MKEHEASDNNLTQISLFKTFLPLLASFDTKLFLNFEFFLQQHLTFGYQYMY